MMMPLSMSGKLLCNMGYHKLVAVFRYSTGLTVESMKCSRCGFAYVVEVTEMPEK